MYNAPAFFPYGKARYKARSGSSVWLERSPVTAEVAGSSPVRFVPGKKERSPMVTVPFCFIPERAGHERAHLLLQSLQSSSRLRGTALYPLIVPCYTAPG